MTPADKGRYCNACQTAVIDFSTWTDKAVQNYFIAQQGKGFCGRFSREQVDRIVINFPENILTSKLAGWKRFLIIVLLCFGNSFMGIDASLGKSPAFYQGEPVTRAYKSKAPGHTTTPEKKKRARKKKKRKATFKYTRINIDPATIQVMGYTTTCPVPLPGNGDGANGDNIFVEDSPGMYQKKSLKFYAAGLNTQPPPPGKDKHPGNYPFEAILAAPARLLKKPRSVFYKK